MSESKTLPASRWRAAGAGAVLFAPGMLLGRVVAARAFGWRPEDLAGALAQVAGGLTAATAGVLVLAAVLGRGRAAGTPRGGQQRSTSALSSSRPAASRHWVR